MQPPLDFPNQWTLRSELRFHSIFADTRHPRLLLLLRSKEAVVGADGAETLLNELADALSALGDLSQLVVINDTRGVRPNDDPSFERIAAEGFTRLLRPFGKAIIVVGTQTGALHIHRLTRRFGIELDVFVDPREALLVGQQTLETP